MDGSWECIEKVVNWGGCVANPGDTENLLNGLLSTTVEVLEGVNEDYMVCWDKCGWNRVQELIESNGFGTFVVVGDWKNGFWWVVDLVDLNLVALGSDYFDFAWLRKDWWQYYYEMNSNL